MLIRTSMAMMAAAFVALAPAAAPAQNFPDRPLTLTLGYGPGASTDLVARFSAEMLSGELGQPVVVDNRPGANQLIATRYMIQQPADGYSLFFSALTLAYNIHAFKEPNYTLDDFVTIGSVAQTGYTLFVNTKKSGATTLEEFIAYGRANPGSLTVASLGPGSAPAIVAHRINSALNLGWREIQYRSAADAMIAVVAGQVDVYTAAPSTAKAQMEQPDIKVFAVSGEGRSPIMPDVPNFSEVGVSIEDAIVFGVFAPKGTPEPVVEKLRNALTEAKKKPEIRERIETAGFTIVEGDYADMDARLKAAGEIFAEDMRQLNLEPQ